MNKQIIVQGVDALNPNAVNPRYNRSAANCGLLSKAGEPFPAILQEDGSFEPLQQPPAVGYCPMGAPQQTDRVDGRFLLLSDWERISQGRESVPAEEVPRELSLYWDEEAWFCLPEEE